MTLGRLMLRTVVGGMFAAHGTQKLFGWFGGPGIQTYADNFEKMGVRPGKPNALLAGATETFGGAALAVGAATPLAAAGLIATMLTAIRTVHGRNGPWNADGGYEYNLVLIAALAMLADAGAGTPSVDEDLLDEDLRGPRAAGFAVGMGIVGAGLSWLVSSLWPEPSSEDAAPEPAVDPTPTSEPAAAAPAASDDGDGDAA